MPEGDAVLRTARRLDRALAGKTLERTDFRVPRLAVADLSGGRVVGTATRGKHLLTRIEHDRSWTLHTHLTMEGSWRDYRPGQRWGRPGHTARVVLTTGDRVVVGFSLGLVELLPREQEQDAVEHLGPDALGPDWDAAEAARRLAGQPGVPIRDALLEQRNLAGVGTIFAAEALFAVRVHPQTPAGAVPDLEALATKAHELLEASTDRGRRQMWVYGRDRRPCPRCGTPVRTARTGPPGRERPAYWCPRCQPEPG